MFSLANMKKSTKPENGGSNFRKLEPGLYIAKIEKAEPKQAATGTEYVALTMEVKDFEGNSYGRLWHNLFLTEKMAWVVDAFFTAVGCPIDDDVDENASMTPEQIANVLDGGQVLIHTKIEKSEYNGQERQKPALDIWGPMSGVAPLDDVERWNAIIVEGKDPDEVNDSFINVPEDAPEEVEF